MYLIYRSWESPLGKVVRHLPQPTVLGWIRDLWGKGTYEHLVDLLGVAVYGLDHLLMSGGPPPASMDELRALARTWLSESIQCNVDDHSLRGLAYGLDHEVAYYLVDDAAAAADPSRWSFPLHDGPLPDASGPTGSFTPPVTPIELTRRSGEGTTYAVILACKARHDSIGWSNPHTFSGVRLAELGTVLRETEDSDDWPVELRVLRALVGPGESGIGDALERANLWPDYTEPCDEIPRSHESALRLIDGAALSPYRYLERSVVRKDEHVAYLWISTWRDYFDQWFFFDDVWADAHPDLAASLVHYGYHWDPGCARHHNFLTPCNDNRVLYVAVLGDDGEVTARPAVAGDERAVWRMVGRLWEPVGEERPGDVIARVEIMMHDPDDSAFAFGDVDLTLTRGRPQVAVALGRRIRGDLRAAGITHAAGWIPDRGPNCRALVRALRTDTARRPRRGV
ncbi:hypothetical protein [Nonomuraea sediminis]|uniref:hypothetical protein n=1 Tax=Nonomuraea sediminis TaxID=2835864 RepID=UPI001BDCAD68|nr:hypothetical protein [Nonomuraea sediminis]